MQSPVFEEIDPARDCDCPGCRHWRRILPHSRAVRALGHPAARRVLIVAAAAASAVLGTGCPAAPAAAAHAPHRPGVPAGDERDTPQGHKGPLRGPSGSAARPGASTKVRETTRTEIISRAKKWLAAGVPYSMYDYWSDGYRQDCSGYVSMAWNLPGNEWTGSLGQYAVRISKEELQPGDILLFHNTANPHKGSHVVIFGGWADSAHTRYIAYEQARPRTRRKYTPYAYWSNSSRYLPYRYTGIVEETAGAEPDTATPSTPASTPYPGRAYFGPGADNQYVAELARMLIARGAGRFYSSDPDSRWTEEDRRATRAFQLAQGWSGADADGLPGPRTWDLLVTGAGKDIVTGAAGAARAAGGQVPSSHGVPGYPGRALFRPGAHNEYVTRLGRQLVRKGFGAYYTGEPGPAWDEEDRRAVQAFQRAQGWRGGAADGYPGPETWRRLFS
ncbi:peptidoglycan-binding protein [Streptomyces sp. S.PNR 29]|uniref:peptidoglycan-binding protein n=1 Tax=Streptomyces sp. S.PNR 29 TaxID=2973805 RepID=UPI0025B09D6F|nr:peptidoglycan-binding protein [Streptomyces sp. S.PNR 29]MDN0197050.1 peptidoglycan-binding protein [Streptomyces sp. S.PNR 29]